MSSLQDPLDVINDPLSEDETSEPVLPEGEELEREDTRERPWKGFWPPPPSKPGYPYDDGWTSSYRGHEKYG
ncbi:hypothetical protein KXV92_000345 [Aspergillus fumigatus]|uniref:Uncharacterized protein n=1 Tax=Aspergillus fumigatus TaxID=746128 RepID=A0A9P8SV20_ASPFM|nr:hypothetical protein KXX42_004863 [Aspergillus fumigatus]KAH1754578.1 hypothetical protein KXX56_007900 [Aspergillus fumigatus]KAH1909034.1 hypothetical protein KXV57_002134 [Aspergillus fumigatus]KAH2304708.1 hypothetical protein KXV47_008958 [Aspergillus fumigatus]KAH2662053.1 hypothetical protein KXV32_009445 [Aspergillus fumigatus]